MARVQIVSEAKLGDRIDAARAHVWKWLAAQDHEYFNFKVVEHGNKRTIVPDDLVTLAQVELLVQELAELMATFSIFPHPPEA